MAREIFDYSKCNPNNYAYYGFHLKNGRYHIDTKRIKKLGYSGCFPEGLFSRPRNTHYFIPKHKNTKDWAINILMTIINVLEREWNQEYKSAINKIVTPSETYENIRVEEMMYTCNSDDTDLINFDALLAQIKRGPEYSRVVKGIHLQYLQRIFSEYFRAIWLVIKNRGYSNKEDFGIKLFITYVQEQSQVESNKINPLLDLPHYKHFLLLNKICNFMKHNSRFAYVALEKDPEERDPKIKQFYSSYVYKPKNKQYESGMYAGDWINIDTNFVDETLENLKEFSKELCLLLYNENFEEAYWNSDEELLKILKKEILYPEY